MAEQECSILAWIDILGVKDEEGALAPKELHRPWATFCLAAQVGGLLGGGAVL